MANFLKKRKFVVLLWLSLTGCLIPAFDNNTDATNSKKSSFLKANWIRKYEKEILCNDLMKKHFHVDRNLVFP